MEHTCVMDPVSPLGPPEEPLTEVIADETTHGKGARTRRHPAAKIPKNGQGKSVR